MHLWIRHHNEWTVIPLGHEPVELEAIRRAAEGATRRQAPALRGAFARSQSGERPDWSVIDDPSNGIAVNGVRLSSGFRVLSDRDEISVPGLGLLYFSTERLAGVEPLPRAAHELFCPRCRQRIEPGSPAVRCPGCELWHHQSDELPCWTYAPACAYCQLATAADAGFRWTPEEL